MKAKRKKVKYNEIDCPKCCLGDDWDLDINKLCKEHRDFDQRKVMKGSLDCTKCNSYIGYMSVKSGKCEKCGTKW